MNPCARNHDWGFLCEVVVEDSGELHAVALALITLESVVGPVLVNVLAVTVDWYSSLHVIVHHEDVEALGDVVKQAEAEVEEFTRFVPFGLAAKLTPVVGLGLARSRARGCSNELRGVEHIVAAREVAAIVGNVGHCEVCSVDAHALCGNRVVIFPSEIGGVVFGGVIPREGNIHGIHWN